MRDFHLKLFNKKITYAEFFSYAKIKYSIINKLSNLKVNQLYRF